MANIIKHVTNLNNLVKDTDMKDSSLEEIVVKSSKDSSMAGIFNNAGQHWNHILFWQCMKPNGGGSMPSELESRITSDLGGIDQFKEAFIQAGTTQFGSGWAWLAIDNGKLVVTKSPNASNPLVDGMKPILGCDVWEHSYYIDYRNKRPDYLKAFLDSLVNWEFVASQLD
jgi:Fe-Mn family superoxide dismutase